MNRLYIKTNICLVVLLLGSSFMAHSEGPNQDFTLTVLYDGYFSDSDAPQHWGFACLIEGAEKTILFDTGDNTATLLGNMKAYQLDPSKVDLIALSHDHPDHTSGITGVLRERKGLEVYLPASVSSSLTRNITKAGGIVIPVTGSIPICESVYLTGELGKDIKEQSLILDTQEGLVVIIGCSHPGVVEIVRNAQQIVKRDVYLVMGGFHLSTYSNSQTRLVIDQLKELGVKKVGPAHCTGENATILFQQSFGEDFLEVDIGSSWNISGIQTSVTPFFLFERR